MRSYPRNSPQAAARIVALAMLADGSMCKKELDTFDRLDVDAQIGLDKAEFHAVVQTFCEDLLSAAHSSWSDMCRVDPKTLAELMAEIDSPELRRKLIGLCVTIVEADGRVADGESIVLVAAVEHWGLQREMLKMRCQHV
ncbi:TerB family tellurite resistance protein [Polaromonas sp. AET17H-212]|uniref:tellurite resistance TerB family protein n=1 Tax=Polaromonas sp. AET17H-212 TaxID=1977061 RepID=UPI000BBCF7BD|nr:TerB family tellurite resistance protein [Polaromonas sp. AET17H-212]